MKAGRMMAAALAVGALVGTFGGTAKAEWQSLKEIRAKTPERWTQRYETRGGTVQIDAAIEVPNAETFPILLVKRAPAVSEKKLAGYSTVLDNEEGLLYIVSNDDEPAILSNNMYYKNTFVFEGAEVPELRAENHPLTAREALDAFESEMERLTGVGAEDLALRKTTVYDCVWKFKTSDGERVYTMPVSDTGEYIFEVSQSFAGIPFEPCTQCYGDFFGRDIWGMLGSAVGSIWNTDGIGISASLLQAAEQPIDDVPIRSFADAKKAFEAEILEGHLRSIDCVRLVYAPYIDPKASDTWWLLPVWYVKGGYTHGDADGKKEDKSIAQAEVIFEAQKGVLMDYRDKDSARRDVPKIVTWDELEKRE